MKLKYFRYYFRLVVAVGVFSIPSVLTNFSHAADSKVADTIQTVGFYTKTRMGFGGMLTFEPTPVVLFKNGDALKDIRALGSAEGLSAHKSSRPKDWTQWRTSDGQIEINGPKGWTKLAYTKTMDPLPKGMRLSGEFKRLSGGGNVAAGGSTAISAWTIFGFDRSGRFATNSGSGASASVENTGQSSQVTSYGQNGVSAGTYEIEGYQLTLNYESGEIEQRTIVMDPADPKGALWIDGIGFARAKN